MGSPSFRALARHYFGSVRRLLSGKPLRPRTRIGRRSIQKDQAANNLLIEVVCGSEPRAVSRLGTTENTLVKYYVENQKNGECIFPEQLSTAIKELSGFFPVNHSLLSRFAQETLDHLGEVDVMAVRSAMREHSFWGFEDFFITRFARQSVLIDLNSLLPLGDSLSWTRSLKGKKVLVIHPFANTVIQQYRKRHDLFDIRDFLPDCDLDVLPAVQSVGDNSSQTGFATWFDALDSMRAEIAKRDFDIALIGAGAYGLFLAAECKKQGKVGIHIGGATQLLFGILGRRWIDPTSPDSASVIPYVNEHWTSPRQSEIPLGSSKVEGGCYWL